MNMTTSAAHGSLPPEGALTALGRPGGEAVAPTLPAAHGSLPPEGALTALGRPGGGSGNHFTPACALCEGAGGRVVYETPAYRVIQAEEAGFPAYYRVVWTDHMAEFSDLDAAQRARCIEAVAAVEQALREVLSPVKVNLATLGNVVPHLHWHVIARFDWDSHYPGPVWAAARQTRSMAHEAELEIKLPAVDAAIIDRLKALG